MSITRSWIALGMVLAAILAIGPTAAQDKPREIADQRLTLETPSGSGLLPLYLSANWSRPQAEVTYAVLVFHGDGRNANSYWDTAKKAREAAGQHGAGALLVVPQFLADTDLEPQRPADADKLLRWTSQSWKDGRPALAPAPLSAFDAIDAMLGRLADRATFPNLEQIVLAGHSAGGQIVQRYAVVSTKLMAIGVRVRYVVANPSSYTYFSEDRPFQVEPCATVNRWKYGMERRPPYAAKATPADLERAYVERDVIYLLGANDNDPEGKQLDRTCAARAQGPHRFARGGAYFAYMQKRHPGLKHRKRDVLAAAVAS